MHDNEFEISESLVRKLVDDQFPEWKELALNPIPSNGTDNKLYLLGSEMIVRLPKIDWAVDAVEKECHFLPLLAPLLSFEVPVPLGKGESTEEYQSSWSIYPWLKGENPIVGSILYPDLLANDLARFIKELHSIDILNGPETFRGIPLQDRDAATKAAINELGKTINTPLVELAWQNALDAPVWKNPPVWIHGDLTPGNLLLVNDRLSAVIDFGAMGMGDPACDLIVAWNLLPAGERNIFRDALNVDDATWARGRGWALSVALIQLPYYQTKSPFIAANARHVIDEILQELA